VDQQELFSGSLSNVNFSLEVVKSSLEILFLESISVVLAQSFVVFLEIFTFSLLVNVLPVLVVVQFISSLDNLVFLNSNVISHFGVLMLTILLSILDNLLVLADLKLKVLFLVFESSHFGFADSLFGIEVEQLVVKSGNLHLKSAVLLGLVNQKSLEFISLVGVDTLVSLHISEAVSNTVNAVLTLTLVLSASLNLVDQLGSINFSLSVNNASKSGSMFCDKNLGLFRNLLGFSSQFFNLFGAILEFVLKVRQFLVVLEVIFVSLASIIEFFSHVLVLFFDIFADA